MPKRLFKKIKSTFFYNVFAIFTTACLLTLPPLPHPMPQLLPVHSSEILSIANSYRITIQSK